MKLTLEITDVDLSNLKEVLKITAADYDIFTGHKAAPLTIYATRIIQARNVLELSTNRSMVIDPENIKSPKPDPFAMP
jgi:hypothetical protein